MTEQLPPQSEIGAPPLTPEAAAAMGRIAVLEPQTNMRTMEVGQQQLETNLPAGADIFEPYTTDADPWGLHPIEQPLLPSSLDRLPAGEFKVSAVVEGVDQSFMPTSYIKERQISVSEDATGKRISAEAFKHRWAVGSGAGPLMAELGFTVDGDKVTAVPTPHTLQAAAAKHGVDIRLFPDQGTIDGKDYLEVFKAGGYPISTKEEALYGHDSEDDHLTAIVLGSEPLKDGLRMAASEGLKPGVDTDAAAAGIDTYTATLRAVISPHPDISGESYGKEKGRQTLIDVGSKLGIPADVTNNIIATAQQNGHRFGLAVTNLA